MRRFLIFDLVVKLYGVGSALNRATLVVNLKVDLIADFGVELLTIIEWWASLT
jgi:hypothetical protein